MHWFYLPLPSSISSSVATTFLPVLRHQIYYILIIVWQHWLHFAPSTQHSFRAYGGHLCAHIYSCIGYLKLPIVSVKQKGGLYVIYLALWEQFIVRVRCHKILIYKIYIFLKVSYELQFEILLTNAVVQ